jgi:hypothetical protein
MSKENQIKESAPGKETIKSVRIRVGGVHYSGARVVTLLTTDPTQINLTGSNVIVCDVIRFHPAGVLFEACANEGGASHVVPYANVEIITLA